MRKLVYSYNRKTLYYELSVLREKIRQYYIGRERNDLWNKKNKVLLASCFISNHRNSSGVSLRTMKSINGFKY